MGNKKTILRQKGWWSKGEHSITRKSSLILRKAVNLDTIGICSSVELKKKSATRWFIPEISKISQWTDSKKSESSRKAQKEFSGSWRSIALDSHHTYIVYEVPALWQILHGSFRKVSGWLRNFVRTYVSTSFLEFATKKFYLEMFYLMRKSRILLICIFLEDEVTKVSFLI